MKDIEVKILSRRSENFASGLVVVDGATTFRVVAEYDPRGGARLSYPWVTYIVDRENIPQRFMTYDGALAEVKALALRQYDLAVQEQMRARVNDELREMVEEIAR
jgi:hypothetical protein